MNKVIFILGTGHCGSTLLDLLLGSHSTAFSLGEIYTVLKRNINEPLCTLCEADCDIWTTELRKKLIKSYNPSIYQRLISGFNLDKSTEALFYKYIFGETGKNILIDSSKNSGWILRNGKKISQTKNLEPILIYLSRDGRAVVNSYYRKYPDRGLKNISENWNKRIKSINKCYGSWDFGEKIHISYENLATEPVKTTQEILKMLKLDYEPEMMRFWEHNHHLVNGNAGTKSMLIRFQKEHLHKDWIKANEKGYYKNHELGIKFDERWRTELKKKELAKINDIIAECNKDLIDE